MRLLPHTRPTNHAVALSGALLVGRGLDVLGVRGVVHQGFGLGGVGDLDLGHPASRIGVGVDLEFVCLVGESGL